MKTGNRNIKEDKTDKEGTRRSQVSYKCRETCSKVEAEKQVERTKNRKGMRKINNANMALEGEIEV